MSAVEPEVYRPRSVADVLAAVPTFFGFVPDDSVIVVATHGRQVARFGFRMRLDLPQADQMTSAAAAMAWHLRKQRADGAVLIVISPRQHDAELMIAALLEELNDLEIVMCARADGENYWVPGDAAPHSYDSRLHHPAVLSAIAAGQEILASRSDIVRRFQSVADADVATAIQGALQPTLAAVAGCQTPAALRSAALSVIGPVLDSALSSPEALQPAAVATLAVWTASISVRDEVLQRTTRANAADMVRVWSDVARRAPGSFVVAPLGIAAFAAWLSGDGVQAGIAAERALEIDPGNAWAALIGDLLRQGVDPRGWAGWESVEP